ncbi:transketolase [Steroidobacter denitrificans]|uniref:Transketolase n=1 Tax=Steroidobacter denitrificans TaxID=465721 RepID=A0A127F7L2_STEDE|nr:transketolase [Steroidobacter denitrificans]AMN46436.1 transketolase [Steroidobacter denitrificans]
MTSRGGSSHIGAVFSMADIVAVLYGHVMIVNPSDPCDPGRDRFILSKGHAGAGIYAALAERGFFPKELLRDHYKNGSVMSGHVSHKGIAGVEFSTGSLGHGLGVACGMAYAAQLAGKTHRVFILMSDGECDEGSNWEAIHFAGHHRLGRVVAVVDYNKIQSLKATEETLGLEPFAEKWRSFRWETVEVDGHDHSELRRVLDVRRPAQAKPLCVIAHTIKGKGVSFMENSVLWHYRTARGAELQAARRELGVEE